MEGKGEGGRGRGEGGGIGIGWVSQCGGVDEGEERWVGVGGKEGGKDGGRNMRGFLFPCSEGRWLERNCFVGGGG